MSTRSITRITLDGRPLLAFYRHHDGYPQGHGLQVERFLRRVKLVNGIGPNAKSGCVANGLGDLAAQLLVALKGAKVGEIYIVPFDTLDDEEYNYALEFATDVTRPYHCEKLQSISCSDAAGKVLYKGDLRGFRDFCQSWAGLI